MCGGFKEGFGNIVAEAMRAEIPVIVAKSGALPEVVGDAGLFFNAKDYFSLEKNIKYLIKNNDEYIKISKLASKRSEYFSTVAFAERFLFTTREILKDIKL